MLYRVTIDCLFEDSADADALAAFAKSLISRASNVNEGKDNEELSIITTHKCYHDEGLECTDEETTLIGDAASILEVTK